MHPTKKFAIDGIISSEMMMRSPTDDERPPLNGISAPTSIVNDFKKNI
jgi:hypothetical protein